MSILDLVEQPKEEEPTICTIAGEAGIGKTSMACAFPKPIVIRIEDGLKSVPIEQRPDALPLIKDIDQLFGYLRNLIKDEHDYQTLIVDSVTQLETLFIEHLLDIENEDRRKFNKEEVSSINTIMGGYGAGYSALAALHGRVRKAAQVLSEKRGMHIVFIAHADLDTVDLPDQDPYSRYTLRLHKKSMSHYVDNVDLVGYLKLDTFVKGAKEAKIKKAQSEGERILVTYSTANNVSKNRYGITEDLVVAKGENPLKQYIKGL